MNLITEKKLLRGGKKIEIREEVEQRKIRGG